MDIEAAVLRVQALVGAVTGIREAPDYPPGQISVWPTSVCWVRNVTWVLGDATCYNVETGTIILEIHWDRQDLKRDVAYGMDYVESIPKAVLVDHDLNNNLDIVRSMTGTFGAMDWNGQQTIGWHYELEFAGHEAAT